MANNCANQLTVEGSADQVAAFRERAKGDKEALDLNKFIPMPKELRDTDYPNRSGKTTAELTEKYGATNWYTWSIINWGVKWNCYEVKVDEKGDDHVAYRFYTAWEPFDQSVLRKMSEEYPELLFNLTFAEHLMDLWGVWDAGGGDILEETGGAGIASVSTGGVYGIAAEGAALIHQLAEISG